MTTQTLTPPERGFRVAIVAFYPGEIPFTQSVVLTAQRIQARATRLYDPARISWRKSPPEKILIFAETGTLIGEVHREHNPMSEHMDPPDPCDPVPFYYVPHCGSRMTAAENDLYRDLARAFDVY